MKIEIHNHRKTFAVQEEFNNFFPNLKMEFYERPSKPGGPSSDKLIKGSTTLGACRNIPRIGSLTILPSMTVGELKQNLMDVFGLTIDIVQKSGTNSWNGFAVSERSVLSELNK